MIQCIAINLFGIEAADFMLTAWFVQLTAVYVVVVHFAKHLTVLTQFCEASKPHQKTHIRWRAVWAPKAQPPRNAHRKSQAELAMGRLEANDW